MALNRKPTAQELQNADSAVEAVLLEALKDIAGRFGENSKHHAWARAQPEPCTCVVHVARAAIARAAVAKVKGR